MYKRKERNKYRVAVGVLCAFGLVGFLGILGYLPINSADSALTSNINSTNKWAWNDVVGWIDFHRSGNGVYVASDKLQQSAIISADPTGYIVLDCYTAPGGSVCGASMFSVSNAGDGNLAGYAWNDTYGWISFCGNATSGSTKVGDHWECPASPTYQVEIDMPPVGDGDFSGYAWNDVIGWIQFNDDPNYKVSVDCTDECPLAEPGYLESSTFDTGATGGFTINSITWKGTLPDNTAVKFRIAVFDDEAYEPSDADFKGAGGSSGSYYEICQPAFADGLCRIPVDSLYHYPYETNETSTYRYFRYRVYIDNGYQDIGPVVEDVIINWSS